jgi:hypothetical protein
VAEVCGRVHDCGVEPLRLVAAGRCSGATAVFGAWFVSDRLLRAEELATRLGVPSDEEAREVHAKIATLDDETLVEMMTAFLQPPGWADASTLGAVNDFTALTARTLWCEVASRPERTSHDRGDATMRPGTSAS